MVSDAHWRVTGDNDVDFNTAVGTTNGPLVMKTNGAEALRIEPTGKVGIGTTAPEAQLHVASESDNSPPHFQITNTGDRRGTASGAAWLRLHNTGQDPDTGEVLAGGWDIEADENEMVFSVEGADPLMKLVGGIYPPRVGINLGSGVPEATLHVSGVTGGNNTPGIGVYGENTAGGTGVHGFSYDGIGTSGASIKYHGIDGWSEIGYGVFGATDVGYAGVFFGRVRVTGLLEKMGGGFKIDHPLDSANRYLNHSFVESSDMKNIYDGVVLLDRNGEAMVELPSWFEPLNHDFRYQLTPLGAPAPNLHVAQKISNGRFKIAGGQSGMEVSWQVTGIRQDAWAQANPLVVEEEKAANERGYYLYPEAYGQSSEQGIEWGRNPEMMRRLKEQRRSLPRP